MSATTIAFCTIVARNYMAYALAMLTSVERVHPEAARYVLIVDGFDRLPEPALERHGIAVLCPSDLMPYELAMSLAYSYDITEYSTALKPFLLNSLLDIGHESVLYLDPDILLFESLQPDVLEPLQSASIVLTPHTTDPIPVDGCMPTEVTLLLAGTYNLGFIGVRETDETRRFLAWWGDRLERYCVNEVENGLFVDQKWIDLVPGMFPNTCILRHRGLNVAYWNLHARQLVQRHTNTFQLASGAPLLFFHFSGFDCSRPHDLSRHQNRIDVKGQPALAVLLEGYAALLLSFSHAERRLIPYGNGVFSDGTRVDPAVRAVCRKARERGVLFPDARDVDARPSLLDYCNSSESGTDDTLPRLTRYLAALWAARADLRATPILSAAGREAFFQWVRHNAGHGIDRALAEAAFANPRDRSRGLPVVTVTGYFRAESGVGEAGRAHVAAIKAAGYDVALVDVSVHAALSRHGEAAGEGVRGAGAVNVVCINADQIPHFLSTTDAARLTNCYNIGSWWWELPNFPAQWSDSFAPFDEIWVGSNYVRRSVAGASPIPVLRVPPIVAPPPVRDPRKERFGMRRDAFVFLYLFDYLSHFERKNPLAIVRAFQEAFPRRTDVQVIFKTINSHRDPMSAAILRAACASDRRIEIIEAYLTRDEKNAMIASADCYVSLHRAEGFGLTIAEAMYYGTPVICTDWSGNCDFSDESNAFVVAAPLVRLERDYGPYFAGQMWAEPDLDQAAAAMRRVADDRVEALERSLRAEANIRTNFSAEAVGRLAGQRLALAFDQTEAIS